MKHHLIGTEIDKLGSKVAVYFCKGEDINTEVTSFFLTHLADLIESGHATRNYMPNLTNARIIYLKINDEIAGHIIWEWQGNDTTYIIFTTIDNKYNKRGLYSIMHRYYEDRIKKGGALYSKSQLHINNSRIISISKQNGYEVEYYKMIKKL
jgi:hypothetical protein